jgi:hypothetical protein
MPLKIGDLTNDQNFSNPISQLVHEGKPQKQAVAIAHSYKRKQKRGNSKATKRAVEKMWG